jgi:hypothetical protein
MRENKRESRKARVCVCVCVCCYSVFDKIETTIRVPRLFDCGAGVFHLAHTRDGPDVSFVLVCESCVVTRSRSATGKPQNLVELEPEIGYDRGEVPAPKSTADQTGKKSALAFHSEDECYYHNRKPSQCYINNTTGTVDITSYR